MKKTLFIGLFVFIFLLGVFLRFFKLGEIPNALDWDEVSWGYSAYSILETGKDEYGLSYPLSFKAFGDYKQPLYIYLDVLPVKLFGLTPFATRFPSAFFGSLSMIFVFLLTKECFKKIKNVEYIALLAMGVFALSPWSIQLSRVAFEANVALFFVISGAWIFLRAYTTQKPWQFLLGTVLLVLSTFTYHSEKLFTPILFIGILGFGFTFFKKRKILLCLIVGLFILCNLIWVLDARTTQRGRGVLFTSSPKLLDQSVQEMIYDKQHKDMVGMMIHNRRVVYAKTYIGNYLAHFNPNWLFTAGDNGRHHPPDMGDLLLIDLPFILVGIFFLVKEHFSKTWILFYWFLVAPLASSLAQDAPNASRSMVFLPTWQIFAAYGWYQSYTLLKQKPLFKIGLVITLLAFLCNFIFFLHQYFAHTNTNAQMYWQYGYKEAIEYTQKEKSGKNKVIYGSDFEQPYIFYLFYTHYNPQKYIVTGGSDRMQKSCFAIDTAWFGDCASKLEAGDYYVTIKPSSLANTHEAKTILYWDGTPAVHIYKVQ